MRTARYGTRALCAAAGIGAGLMYLLDPQGGRGRRALLRDQLDKGRRKGAGAITATRRDVTNRATGAVTRARDLLRRGPVDDRTVEERVRARMGHAVAHPGALEVSVERGQVTLRGPVLQTEVGRLLSTIRRTPGVRRLVSELDVYSAAGRVPSLQGDGPTPWRAMFRPASWSPVTIVLIGTAGAFLAWRIVTLAMAADAGQLRGEPDIGEDPDGNPFELLEPAR